MEVFLDSYGEKIKDNDLLQMYFMDNIEKDKEHFVEEKNILIKEFNQELYGIEYTDENNLNNILYNLSQNGLNKNLITFIKISTLMHDEYLFEIKHKNT